MPPVPFVPAELRNAVFRGSAVVRIGLLTPNQLRGPAWRPLFKDVYAHAEMQVTHALRTRVAAQLVVPEAVVTGRSAAVLWGVELAGPDDDIELTLPPSAHPRRIPGVRVRRAHLRPEHVRRRRGVLVTSPEMTAVRVAGSLPRDDAVAAVDQLIATRLVDLTSVRELAAATRGPGSARARAVAELADGLAESPPETRLRLLIGRSSLPAPVAQYRVIVDGRFVARVDFAWPAQKVAVEYDGLWHAEAGQFARDRQRLNRLHAAGWRVVFVTAADMHRPAELLARIASALSA
jgi:hypothetical protein